MALSDACVEALRDWRFLDAFDRLDGYQTEEEGRWLQGLALTFANIGRIEGEMGSVIEAAVAGVLSSLPRPAENRANKSYLQIADRYNRKATLARDCVDRLYEHVRLPSDDEIPRRNDFADLPKKVEYAIYRIDVIRSIARQRCDEDATCH